MGTLVAYGPDVVGLPGGPPHGLVELWMNTNINSFAGQTITLTNVSSNIDAVLIDYGEYLSGNRILRSSGTAFAEIDGGGALLTYTVVSDNRVSFMYRSASAIRDGNDIKITFSDCALRKITTYGSATSEVTNNEECLPIRILGLIHNS